MKLINLECEYLDEDFYFVYDCQPIDVIRWAKKKLKIDLGTGGLAFGKTWWFEDKNGYINIIIWIDNKRNIFKKIYTVYHEVGHAVLQLFRRCGVDPFDSNGEHFVYLQEYLVNQILRKLNKKKK